MPEILLSFFLNQVFVNTQLMTCLVSNFIDILIFIPFGRSYSIIQFLTQPPLRDQILEWFDESMRGRENGRKREREGGREGRMGIWVICISKDLWGLCLTSCLCVLMFKKSMDWSCKWSNDGKCRGARDYAEGLHQGSSKCQKAFGIVMCFLVLPFSALLAICLTWIAHMNWNISLSLLMEVRNVRSTME